MNLRKGLIAAATALTVSVAGVGVASATTTTTTTAVAPLPSGSSLLDKDDEKEGATGDDKGSSLSSTGKEGEETTELSSEEGLKKLTGVLKLVSTAVGAVATIYGALTALDIL